MSVRYTALHAQAPIASRAAEEQQHRRRLLWREDAVNRMLSPALWPICLGRQAADALSATVAITRSAVVDETIAGRPRARLLSSSKTLAQHDVPAGW